MPSHSHSRSGSSILNQKWRVILLKKEKATAHPTYIKTSVPKLLRTSDINTHVPTAMLTEVPEPKINQAGSWTVNTAVPGERHSREQVRLSLSTSKMSTIIYHCWTINRVGSGGAFTYNPKWCPNCAQTHTHTGGQVSGTVTPFPRLTLLNKYSSQLNFHPAYNLCSST